MLIPGIFVISALKLNDKGELETVYYAEDYASGGYPYWTEYFGSAKTFKEKPNFEERVGSCTYMYEKVTMVKAYNVQLVEA